MRTCRSEHHVNPGAVEDCSLPSEDLNCDGSVGYADADGDFLPACEDCDDSSAERNNQTIWYRDADSDGYGSVSDNVTSCLSVAGYVMLAGDCDDSDPLRWDECVDVVIEIDTAIIHDTVYVRDTVTIYVDDNEYRGGWRCGVSIPEALDLALVAAGVAALRRRRAT
jgi:hypothetical protein